MNKEELNNAMLAHITEALGYAELHEEFKTKIMKAVSHFMPHTCTATERMFLDEIREKGKYRENIGCVYIPGTASELYERDFKIVLKELVNE